MLRSEKQSKLLWPTKIINLVREKELSFDFEAVRKNDIFEERIMIFHEKSACPIPNGTLS
jgi:(p)ppGpp synthase/HD superfamily hydrolase